MHTHCTRVLTLPSPHCFLLQASPKALRRVGDLRASAERDLPGDTHPISFQGGGLLAVSAPGTQERAFFSQWSTEMLLQF